MVIWPELVVCRYPGRRDVYAALLVEVTGGGGKVDVASAG